MKAYQLRIQMKDSNPPIWREAIVPAGLSFSQLGVVLNEIMGWCGDHLFSFEFPHLGIQIEEELDEFDDFENFDDFGRPDFKKEEASETIIDSYLDTEIHFTYVYDFGDDWQHLVTVEKILEDYDKNYPQVLKYKGETPYEDCGGLEEYYNLLEILKDPKHSEYKDTKAWVNDHFWTEYNLATVNAALAKLYLSDEVSAPMTSEEIYEDIEDEEEPFKQIDPTLMDLSFFEDEIEEEKRSWKNITLKEIFSTYEKKELLDIAKNHKLKGCTKLKKKDLVERLSKAVLEKDAMQRYFCYLDDVEMELMEGNENVVESEWTGKNYDLLTEGGYGAYKFCCGIEFMYIPQEVKDAYRRNCDEEWKRLREPARELMHYLNMLAELYGICPIGQFLEVYQLRTNKKRNEFEVLSFAEEIPENMKVFLIKDGKIIFYSLKDPGIYGEFMDIQGQTDYYIPTAEDAECFIRNGNFPFDAAMRRLQKFFLENGEDSNYDAENLCKRIQFLIRTGYAPEDVLEMLEECFMGYEEMLEDEKIMDAFLDKLMDAVGTTRIMLLRGHTPEEFMNPKPSRTRKHTPKKSAAKNTKKSSKIVQFPGK